MKDKVIFIDAETNGLYGEFISVAMIVLDKYGSEIEQHYYGRSLDDMIITDAWVMEHVIPQLGEYEKCESKESLLERTWSIWSKYAEEAYVIADVSFPVESRIWQECVKQDMKERKFRAPFPLMDLSSMLYAKGINPLRSRLELVEMEDIANQHNALYDVKVSVAVWKKYFMEQY